MFSVIRCVVQCIKAISKPVQNRMFVMSGGRSVLDYNTVWFVDAAAVVGKVGVVVMSQYFSPYFFSAPLPSYMQGDDPSYQQSAELYAIKFCLSKAVALGHVWSDKDLIVSDSQSALHTCLRLCVKSKAKVRGRVVRSIVKAMGDTTGINVGFVPGCVNPADGPSRLQGGYVSGWVSCQLGSDVSMDVLSKCKYVLSFPRCIAYCDDDMSGHVQWWASVC